MSKKQKFIDRQWRLMVWFFRIFPLWIALILGINIWHDADQGKPFDWSQVLIALGMIAFAGVVLFFSRLIFKAVSRYVTITDRNSR